MTEAGINQENNSSDVTEAQPFRLFDLPQEIQDNIYCQFHGSYDLEVRYCSGTPHGSYEQSPIVRGFADFTKLELTCKKIGQNSSKWRKKAYSGILRFVGVHHFHPGTLGKLEAWQENDWILKATTYLDFLLHSWSWTTPKLWRDTLDIFPALKKLDVVCCAADTTTGIGDDLAGWQSIIKEILNGDMDEVFLDRAAGLSPGATRVYLERQNRTCQIHYKHLLKLNYPPDKMCDVFVKFEMTPNGWTVVDRTAGELDTILM